MASALSLVVMAMAFVMAVPHGGGTTLKSVSFPECPGKPCAWDETTLSMDCRFAHCTSFPVVQDEYSQRIQHMDLEVNQLTNLSGLASQSLLSLRTLSLAHNNITKIQQGDFLAVTSLHELDLSYNMLRAVEGDPFKHIIGLSILRLQHNHMDLVQVDAYRGVRMSLRDLDLSNNRIVFIERDNTYGTSALDLSFLQTLNMTNNALVSLDKESLRSLSRLKDFRLSGNRLATLSSDVFENLIDLEFLDLSYNQLQHADPFAFRGPVRLKELRLDGNVFTGQHLDLSDLSRLQTLSLDNTKFKVISPDTVSFPVSLESVTISSCTQLRRIGDHAFWGLPSLQSVQMTSNPHLVTVSKDAFGADASKLRTLLLRDNGLLGLDERMVTWRQLEQLDLSGNSWHCDCHLGWMLVAALPGRSMERVTCSSPRQLAGQSLAEVRVTDLVCSHSLMPHTGLEVGLLVIATVALLAVLGVIVVRWRHALCPCCRGNASKYAALYNVADDDRSQVGLKQDLEQKAMVARSRHVAPPIPEPVRDVAPPISEPV